MCLFRKDFKVFFRFREKERFGRLVIFIFDVGVGSRGVRASCSLFFLRILGLISRSVGFRSCWFSGFGGFEV